MDRLNEVFETTLKAIEDGKEEIFNISETTRAEAQRLTKELTYLRAEIKETIEQVNILEKYEKNMRQQLMEVNKNYKKYSESEMMEVYSQTKDAQVELQLLYAKELQLRSRRDEIERTLRNLEATVERAENLMNQVSLAMSLLKEGITEISQFYNNQDQKEIGFTIIKAQEEERRRVAREIHDGPAQSLANIVLRLEIAEKLMQIDGDKVKKELHDLKYLVRNNLKDIRRIIFDLRPMVFDDNGITATLKNYIQSYQKTYGIECELLIEGSERRLNSSIEIALFRIIQEGMTNVAKHADSNDCSIRISFDDNFLSVQITDQGKGFDTEEVLQNTGEHFGLIGIKERIKMYSGKFSIKSSYGNGTVFEFSIPYSSEGGQINDQSSDR